MFTIDHGNTPIKPSRVRKEIVRMCDDLDVERFTPYSLRHFAASHALQNGIGLVEVAHMIGDNPQTVANTYAHFIPTNATAQPQPPPPPSTPADIRPCSSPGHIRAGLVTSSERIAPACAADARRAWPEDPRGRVRRSELHARPCRAC